MMFENNGSEFLRPFIVLFLNIIPNTIYKSKLLS